MEKQKLTKNRYEGGPCEICGNTGYHEFKEFDGYRDPQGRPNVYCRVCKSVLRQRQFFNFIKSINLSDKKVLYFSPHASIEKKVRELCGECITADIVYKPEGMKVGKIDVITDIQNLIFEDKSFDVIICKHVLEHVKDDIMAMSELNRILKPSGIAFIMIPFFEKLEKTENFPPQEYYERYFPGGIEHVRRYGKDFTKRFKGWNVKTDNISGEIFIFEKKNEK
jgi:SAM-dependent methyltransferase